MFGHFSCFSDSLESLWIASWVRTGLFFELVTNVGNKGQVEIFSAEHGVTVGGSNFENRVLHFEDGNIEGSSAEIENGNGFVFVASIESVGERRGGRFVDDSHDVQTGDLPGVFGGLSLGVVEVCWDGDDGVRDFLVEIHRVGEIGWKQFFTEKVVFLKIQFLNCFFGFFEGVFGAVFRALFGAFFGGVFWGIFLGRFFGTTSGQFFLFFHHFTNFQ